MEAPVTTAALIQSAGTGVAACATVITLVLTLFRFQAFEAKKMKLENEKLKLEIEKLKKGE